MNKKITIKTNKKVNNNKPMKKDFVLPLIIGIAIGALMIIFLNFGARLNNTTNAVVQLQQATAQNSATVSDIVSFLNQSVGEVPNQE